MASEIRVNKINSQTGVGTITLSPTGVDISGITTVSTLKVGTGLTASEDGDIFFTGVCTATTFAGSGANLTALPAAQLTGALPAISGANLTGIAATDNVRTGILDVAGIATFRNDVNIGAAVTISESGIEATGVGITVANINGGQVSGRRNLVINGAMNIAQRGTSSTTSGYYSLDRFPVYFGGLDEAVTHAQVDVSSGTTPYSLGFRKALKLTNGNQTSGAGTNDNIQIQQRFESQDIANSGWNYTSSTSYITLQFWVKSSVAQNFYVYLRTQDGTGQRYTFETGSLSADTWTKIIKTIPGNSNLQFDNNAENGMEMNIAPFWGTAFTDSSVSLNTWGAYASASRTPDYTSTWYTTNDATFEVTGVQLEVGSQATAFEHRSFGDELALCQRYYYVYADARDSGSTGQVMNAHAYSTAQVEGTIHYPTMRASPSLILPTITNGYGVMNANGTVTFQDWTLYQASPRVALLFTNTNLSASPSTGQAYRSQFYDDNAYIHLEAEL